MGLKETCTYYLKCDGKDCDETTDTHDYEDDAQDEAERSGWKETDAGWLCKKCLAKQPFGGSHGIQFVKERYAMSEAEFATLTGEDAEAFAELLRCRPELKDAAEDLTRVQKYSDGY